MNSIEALSTYWSSKVFASEFIGVFVLTFAIWFASYFFKKYFNSQGRLFLPITFALALIFANVFTWVLAKFYSNTAIYTFLNPANVIFQSLIKGIGKDFTGNPLLKGVPYIIGAQFLAAITANFAYIAAAKIFTWISGSDKNVNKIQVLPADVLPSLENELTIGKHAVKEGFFLMIMFIIGPFIAHLPIAYQANDFDKFLLTVVFIFILLALSSRTNWFMFNLAFSISKLTLHLIYWRYNLALFKNFAISITLYVTLPIIVSLIYLAIAKHSNIYFIL
ncbi:MAG4940 family membrane protein [Candidatus Mycoplasma pogonae]